MANPTTIRLREVRTPREFTFEPDGEYRAALARDLGLIALRKLSLSGRVLPQGDADWRLDARLGATVVQPSVATLDPVTTRIDEPITRRYLAEPPALPDGDEFEMPDDEIEPAPSALDLGAILAEALALSLPDFPREEDEEEVTVSVAGPGVEPMTDEDAKPFAALKNLRDRMSSGESGED